LWRRARRWSSSFRGDRGEISMERWWRVVYDAVAKQPA
jgi:hypothetical protein